MTNIKKPVSFYSSHQGHFKILSTDNDAAQHVLLKIKTRSLPEHLNQQYSDTVSLKTRQYHNILPETKSAASAHEQQQSLSEQSVSSVSPAHVLLETLPTLITIGRAILTTNFVPILNSVHTQLQHCSRSIQQRPIPFKNMTRNAEQPNG